MTDTLIQIITHFIRHFFYMDGYGVYVWPAYGSAILFLLITWFRPWRRWQRHLRQSKMSKK